MHINEYQHAAMSFRLPSAGLDYALLNLSSEVGELHGLVAKAYRDGAKEDYLEQFEKECGDILWTLTALVVGSGYTLEEVAKANIEKLQSRKDRGVLQGSGNDR